MSQTQDTRFIELETRLTYAEDLLDSLNRTVADQQLEILELRQFCEQLLKQLKEAPLSGDSRSAADEIPPHY